MFFFVHVLSYFVEILEYNDEKKPWESMEEKLTHIRFGFNQLRSCNYFKKFNNLFFRRHPLRSLTVSLECPVHLPCGITENDL